MGAAGIDYLGVGETRLLAFLFEMIANLFDGDSAIRACGYSSVRVIIGSRDWHIRSCRTRIPWYQCCAQLRGNTCQSTRVI
jgi:hypothetical protein